MSPSNELFMRALLGLLEACPPANVDVSNTGAVHSGDHVEGGPQGIIPFDGNATSTSDVNSLNQQPSDLRSMSTTPSLTPDAESRSPSDDPSTPMPDSYGVDVQNQPAGMLSCNTPDNRKALEAIQAMRAQNTASAVNGNGT
ncbi:hypothetical protein PENSPDRAFT_654982 [Peniophora sp. CONT]|nr:hypothetical protein PENSPDRAFT_654982 [Peniophora sp. CONT]